MLLAEATNEFYGQWLIVGLGVIAGLGGIASIAGYFATRREMVALEKRVSTIEIDQKDDRRNSEIHASERSKTIFSEIKDTREKLENRINPLVENTAALKASHEAFTNSFINFTNVMQEMIRQGSNGKGKP